MNNHQITDETFETTFDFASSSGPNHNKRMVVKLKDWKFTYVVTDRGAVTYDGPNRLAAIDAYNEAP